MYRPVIKSIPFKCSPFKYYLSPFGSKYYGFYINKYIFLWVSDDRKSELLTKTWKIKNGRFFWFKLLDNRKTKK